MQPLQKAAVGSYELVLPLATGKMAEIYVARQKDGDGSLVAMKCIRTELKRDPVYVTMLLDEARLASHIQSPHVTPILDCGLGADGAPFIVMELVIGATIAQITAAYQALQVSDVLEILAQAAEGLHAAHEARDNAGQPLQIVHRDVSPTNILVGLDGRTRVCDFGIAWAERRTTETRAGQVKGTLRYLSPEQTRAERVDRRSDVFSLGVVAWEFLTGKALFTGSSMMAIIHAILERPVPPLHKERSDVPRAVTEVVARALSRNRDMRFPTAAAFGHALRAAAREIGEASPARIGAHVAEILPVELRSLPSALGMPKLPRDLRPPRADTPSSESVVSEEAPTLRQAKPKWVAALTPKGRARDGTPWPPLQKPAIPKSIPPPSPLPNDRLPLTGERPPVDDPPTLSQEEKKPIWRVIAPQRPANPRGTAAAPSQPAEPPAGGKARASSRPRVLTRGKDR